MSDKNVYFLNNDGDSIIDKNIETMSDWLASLSDKDLSEFHKICNKNTDDRSEEEDYEICRHSLVLYCRELDLNELAITEDLLITITGMFSANIIFESLIRRGYAKSNSPLLIYKDCSIEITEKGRKFLDEENKK